MMIRYNTYLRAGLISASVLLLACKPPVPLATPTAPQEIKQKIVTSTAPLTLVHIWATWCDPCREEFPQLVKVIREFQSLEVILISADAPGEIDAVETFLAEHHSPVDSLITTELNQKFIETLSPDWGGALPSTFFYREGKLVSEWEGKRTFEDYAETIETLLNK